MRVLVACEFSGIVRDAFIARGHDAISCDLLPTERPGPHIQGDVLDVLDDEWDMLLAFPPCTHLSSSGAAYWPQKQKDGRQQAAIHFFMDLVKSPIKKIAIENPVGIMSRLYRKPDQIIHPYQFGDKELKRTCLWLKWLPVLVPTSDDPPPKPRGHCTKSSGRKYNYYYHQGKNGKARSRFFLGIARAMAEQWG